MKCAELIEYWDAYVSLSLYQGHSTTINDSNFIHLRQLWNGYSGKDLCAAEANMIVEPYLGAIHPASHKQVKLIMLNLNPGPSRAAHQELSVASTFGRQLAAETYSDWAASWPYLSNPICENWGGPFIHQRMRYAEQLTSSTIQNHEVVAFELFPWHSSRWGFLNGSQVAPALRELVLDPVAEIVNTSGALLIGFGKKWQEFADTIGTIAIQKDLSFSQKTGRFTRRFVQYQLPNNLRLNLLINQGYAGPPREGHPDIEIIRELILG